MNATGVTEAKTATTEPTEPTEPETLAKDDLFHLLQNERRRRAVTFLLDQEESVDMGDIAEHIAALENDISIPELSSAQRKRVYVGLYQCHLPKLDEAGVIDYDKNRGTVARTHLTDSLAPYLTVDDGEADDDVAPPSLDTVQYPMAATAVAAVLTAASWASVLPAAGLWLPTALTLAFGVATLATAVR
ncbi:DUF7344 domain-containing protein [Halomarina oriensis]|uniref:DUF7344 domain-containing protein n=1 Tax=Halomarina oriensis TaxID=671145 RepID=A0A6B0GGZ5_9EURY|nr:hypothetical protein [Halomarina oriensis]MWG33227.1 hypothetical protein [Halomarina oriensis]